MRTHSLALWLTMAATAWAPSAAVAQLPKLNDDPNVLEAPLRTSLGGQPAHQVRAVAPDGTVQLEVAAAVP
ncbi:MAG: hypothetical protein AB7I30_22075, partial [Isosphaeraceae bacterium]